MGELLRIDKRHRGAENSRLAREAVSALQAKREGLQAVENGADLALAELSEGLTIDRISQDEKALQSQAEASNEDQPRNVNIKSGSIRFLSPPLLNPISLLDRRNGSTRAKYHRILNQGKVSWWLRLRIKVLGF